ncbi:MAG: hypothetical protein VKI63_00635 [Cyanobium sp.]|nr:hypothetical protein [Cyanobium sp.]
MSAPSPQPTLPPQAHLRLALQIHPAFRRPHDSLRLLGLRPQSLSRSLCFRVAVGLGVTLAFSITPAAAQQTGSGQTTYSVQEQRELDAGGGPSRSSVLDATNPIDLMNRIRRATAMDEATTPGDAVDAALKDFNSQPVSPGSGLTQGP